MEMNTANLGAVTPSTRSMPLLTELGFVVPGFVFYKHGAPDGAVPKTNTAWLWRMADYAAKGEIEPPPFVEIRAL
jgi:hypothetical protein